MQQAPAPLPRRGLSDYRSLGRWTAPGRYRPAGRRGLGKVWAGARLQGNPPVCNATHATARKPARLKGNDPRGQSFIAKPLGDRNAVDALTGTLDHVVIDRGDQIKADAEAIRQLAGRVP